MKLHQLAPCAVSHITLVLVFGKYRSRQPKIAVSRSPGPAFRRAAGWLCQFGLGSLCHWVGQCVYGLAFTAGGCCRLLHFCEVPFLAVGLDK